MRTPSLFLPLALIFAAPLAASAQDASAWAGAYGGVQLSYGDGFQDYGGGSTYDIYGESYGLFAGYMWTTGAWAYGAELAYANASFHEYDGPDEYPDYQFNHTLDLKARAERWRLSPNLTWYPSEFSKIRLQYNYDDRLRLGTDHSVWLQFEFLLGAHAAHKF